MLLFLRSRLLCTLFLLISNIKVFVSTGSNNNNGDNATNIYQASQGRQYTNQGVSQQRESFSLGVCRQSHSQDKCSETRKVASGIRSWRWRDIVLLCWLVCILSVTVVLVCAVFTICVTPQREGSYPWHIIYTVFVRTGSRLVVVLLLLHACFPFAL